MILPVEFSVDPVRQVLVAELTNVVQRTVSPAIFGSMMLEGMEPDVIGVRRP